jgi:hypothetical protein
MEVCVIWRAAGQIYTGSGGCDRGGITDRFLPGLE